MKKFVLCKICLVVFVALFAAESVIAGNWNKNSDSERVDDQYAQIDKAGKGIQWRLRPTSLISRVEQIIFVPDPLLPRRDPCRPWAPVSTALLEIVLAAR